MNRIRRLICRWKGHNDKCIKLMVWREQKTLHGHYCLRCGGYGELPDIPWGPEIALALRPKKRTPFELPPTGTTQGLMN